MVGSAVNMTTDILNDLGSDTANYLDYAFYGMLGLAGLAAGTQVMALLAYLCSCCFRRCSARTHLAFVGLYFIGCDLFMLLVVILYNGEKRNKAVYTAALDRWTDIAGYTVA